MAQVLLSRHRDHVSHLTSHCDVMMAAGSWQVMSPLPGSWGSVDPGHDPLCQPQRDSEPLGSPAPAVFTLSSLGPSWPLFHLASVPLWASGQQLSRGTGLASAPSAVSVCSRVRVLVQAWSSLSEAGENSQGVSSQADVFIPSRSWRPGVPPWASGIGWPPVLSGAGGTGQAQEREEPK
jgi:hypothetical protein